jgi:hypothetical protein
MNQLNENKNKNSNYEPDELNYCFTTAIINNLDVKIEKNEDKSEYTKETVELLSGVLLKILNDSKLSHEKIVIFCKFV